jgi:uncharacterized protein with PIN domain
LRVGARDPKVNVAAHAFPRLLCDGTLGALCRWLRAAGYDTEFLAPQRRTRREWPSQTEALREAATAQHRTVLTRSPRIHSTLGEVSVLIRDDHPYHQLLEVSRLMGLSLVARALTRCRDDNGVLVIAGQDEVRERVPPYIAATHRAFVRCPQCGRVYWGATHRKSMLERLAELERQRLSPALAPSGHTGPTSA